MTRSIFLTSFLAIQMSLPAFAQDSSQHEDDSAKEACEKVIDLFEERTSETYDLPLEPRMMCTFNARPASYWQCTEDKMLDDQSLSDAMDLCEELE